MLIKVLKSFDNVELNIEHTNLQFVEYLNYKTPNRDFRMQ